MSEPKEKTNFFLSRNFILGIIGLVLTVAICILGFIYKDEITNRDVAQKYGLIGVFLIAFIASSTFSVLPIPIPYFLVTFFSPSILAPQFGILAPVWVSLVTGIAASLGQFVTFMIGYTGISFSQKISRRFSSSVYEHAVQWVKKRGNWAVFLMSLMANPLHLPMTLAFAALRYPPYLFVLFTFLGVWLKSLVIAFAGYYGLNTLYEWMAGKLSTISLILTIVLIGLLIIAAGIWQLYILKKETDDKNRKYKSACDSAKSCGKPVLVVGGPWGTRAGRRFFKKPAHGSGDVCLDIDFRALTGHPCPVVASATHIPFADKTFGAVFLSHVLEHLPTTQDAKQAVEEMNRVADEVFIVYPSRQSIGGWLTPGHKLWVWQEGNKIFLKQRGKTDDRESIVVEIKNHKTN